MIDRVAYAKPKQFNITVKRFDDTEANITNILQLAIFNDSMVYDSFCDFNLRSRLLDDVQTKLNDERQRETNIFNKTWERMAPALGSSGNFS